VALQFIQLPPATVTHICKYLFSLPILFSAYLQPYNSSLVTVPTIIPTPKWLWGSGNWDGTTAIFDTARNRH